MPNPILKNCFDRDIAIEGDAMTINGAIFKSAFLLLSIIVSAGYTWHLAAAGYMDKFAVLVLAGFVGALISGLIVVFAKPRITPILAIIYAVCEGLCLGGISVAYATSYSGIVIKAIVATFAVMAAMLFLYVSRIIVMTQKLRSVMITATFSIMLIYFIQIAAGFFGRSIPLIFSSGPAGIAFSIFVILVGAINIFADFYIIEEGANNRLPKMYEWIAAVGLMFSLVWVYLEILRLFAKRD